MSLPKPVSENLFNFLQKIEKGLIQIPRFQREFVWGAKDVASLMDSILKGYPIGTFILWKTKEELGIIKEIIGLDFPKHQPGEDFNYVLDGQQRILSIYCAMKNPRVNEKWKGKINDFSNIKIDLHPAEDQDNVVYEKNINKQKYVPLKEFIQWNSDGIYLSKRKIREVMDYNIKEDIEEYEISTIEIEETEISRATEIFTRINSKGKDLNIFEIIAAKTFKPQEFDLAEKWDEIEKKLEKSDYATIKGVTMLQAVSAVIEGNCSRKKILDLNKEEFIEEWDKVEKAFFKAIDHFRNSYKVSSSRLLPYNVLLVPFTYFFYKNKTNINETQYEYLKEVFWKTIFAEQYFGSGKKINEYFKRMQEIINKNQYEFDYGYLSITPEDVKNKGKFTPSDAYIKAILCVLASKKPTSLESKDTPVTLSNENLSRSNSRNFHHFFPKKYMKEHGMEKGAEHIANIIFLNAGENQEIKKKPPHVYLEDFEKRNSELSRCLKDHHLIDIKKDQLDKEPTDLAEHYEKFIDSRCKSISDAICEMLPFLKEEEKN